MATPKSDDETEQQESHPLAHNRPGVYVQVIATPRRRKGERGRREADARGQDAEATRLSVPMEELAARPSSAADASTPDAYGERSFGVEPAPRAPVSPAVPPPSAHMDAHGAAPELEGLGVSGAPSENTNHRADLVVVPGPPRMPSISLSGAPVAPKLQAASVLDAPRSLRPDSMPTKPKASWLLMAGVALLSAIITAAVVVALRESRSPQASGRAALPPAVDVRGAAPEQGRPAPSLPPPAVALEPAAQPATPAIALEATPTEPVPEAPPVQAAALPQQAEQVPEAPPAQAAALPQQVEPAPEPAVAARTGRALAARSASAAGRRGSAAQLDQGAVRLTPAQLIADHVRSMPPPELPTNRDTTLPENPYQQ